MSKTIRIAGLGLLTLGLLAASPVFGQNADDEMRDDIEALKQGQQSIRKELGEIKQLLQKQQQAQPARPSGPQVKDVVFNLRDNEVKGERNASLTLIEFTDYQ